ncbi:hypothetical protein [Mucilaginibacter sp. RCC_168]|uniref:hypothetical protein n=1 Tax=unclassified Mucilaginibacter TaxID=2617802 RepID=UPI0035236797
MKKNLLLFTIIFMIMCGAVNAQMATPGPVEQRMTDSLCKSLARLDISKISTKEEAVKAYTECVMAHADLLPDLAAERKVDMTDQSAMRAVGIDLAKNLVKQKCDYFLKLAVKMNSKEVEEDRSITGTFKRIDVKGFNYVIITETGKSERSFLWLRQFPNSERFIGGAAGLIGKKLKITWQELEVYLPQAKGYYKVKEILSIDIL